MKLTIARVGSFKSAEYEKLFDRYLKLSGKFLTTESIELRVSGSERESAVQSDRLLDFLSQKKSVALWVLDERGKTFDSAALSQVLQNKILMGSKKEWVVACAGSHGFSEEVWKKADLVWSLSPLTFPHELAAVVAAEQVFRCLSILNNHPYHNTL